MVKGIAALSLFLLSTTALAAEKDEKKWDVASPPMETHPVKIDVTEGTWMNLDVSPDGRTVAFDFLGDIYTIPLTVDAATRITAALPLQVKLRYSTHRHKPHLTQVSGWRPT